MDKDFPLLNVTNLTTTLSTPFGKKNAVSGISFSVRAGESVGIVGESGSGKTMTSLSLLNLVPRPAAEVTAGSVFFDGKDLLKMPSRELRSVRGGSLSMIFQDALSSLNPFYSVGFQIRETLNAHQTLSKSELNKKVADLLLDVGIPDAKNRINDYPHQFSGGMRQRILIAMALANSPKLLIADEPTTALDVTIHPALWQALWAR